MTILDRIVSSLLFIGTALLLLWAVGFRLRPSIPRTDKLTSIQRAYFEGCYAGTALGDLPPHLDGEAATSYISDYCIQQAREYQK
jgi:hypothetical protein